MAKNKRTFEHNPLAGELKLQPRPAKGVSVEADLQPHELSKALLHGRNFSKETLLRLIDKLKQE